MERSGIPPNVFPQSATGRFVLGLLSMAFIPFSAIFLYACTFGHPGPGWGVWLVRVAMQEFFCALLAGFHVRPRVGGCSTGMAPCVGVSLGVSIDVTRRDYVH
jgi:hypothetical protein